MEFRFRGLQKVRKPKSRKRGKNWSSAAGTWLHCNMTHEILFSHIIFKYIQVHTNTYLYILLRTNMHWYIHYLVQYVQVHTCTYQYILYPDSSKNTKPAICHCLGTREYIPSYTISCTGHGGLYYFVRLCTDLSRCLGF